VFKNYEYGYSITTTDAESYICK